MKKRSIMMSVLAVLLITAMLFSCGGSGNELPISRDEAKEIAIMQLGVTSDVTTYAVVTTAGTADDPYYIVEVLLEGVAYSYRIDPKTGDIRKLTINDQNVDLSDLPVNPSNPDAGYIGLEAAKTAAFSDAGVNESEVTKLDYEMDFAYGKYLYDIEFKANGHEYEYEILAESGEIFKKDVDRVTVIEPNMAENTFIGAERAKEIAIAHAGVSAEEAVFKIVEWDMKKGSAMYDVDFTVGNTEYDYDINATTGNVIKHSSETNGKTDKNPDKNQDSGTAMDHMTPAEAKKIALAHAGVAEEDARFGETELDFERGVEVYEIEFTVGRVEYEYEIDANTGEVIKAEYDYDC